MSDAPEPVEKLPPERRRGGDPVVLYGCCCCCCCCCCLHTVGAVIGAAAAGSSVPAPYAGTEARNLPSSQSLYWTSVVLVVALALAAFLMSGEPHSGVLLLLIGPLLLLLAGGGVMAVRVAVSPTLRRVHRYWSDLGRICLYCVLGTLAGTALMVAAYYGHTLLAK